MKTKINIIALLISLVWVQAGLEGIHDIEYGARAKALGGNYTSVAEDASIIYYNPAGLVNLRFPQASFSHIGNILLEGQYNNISYAHPTAKGVLGISASHINFGDVNEVIDFEPTGNKNGAFDLSLQAAFALKAFDKFGAGGSVKYIRKEINRASGSVLAFDAGVFYSGQLLSIGEYLPDNFRIGVAVRNLGTKLKLFTIEEKIPLTIQGSLYYMPRSLIASTIGGTYNTDNSYRLNFGIELMPRWYASPRIAIIFSDNQLTFNAGLGAKVAFSSFEGKVGYAFEQNQAFNHNHIVSLDFSYNIVETEEDKQYEKLKIEYEEGQRRKKEQVKQHKAAEKLREIRIKNFGQGFSDENKTSIAILQFLPKNVATEEAALPADFISTELVNSGVFLVVDRGNIDQILSEQQLQLSGTISSERLVSAGKLLGVQKLVSGSLSSIGGSYFLTVNVVDIEKGTIDFSLSRETGNATGIPGMCREIAEEITKKFGILE